MKREILKILEQSKKDYDKKSQRAELLKKNKIFLEELKKVKNQLCDNFFKKLEEMNQARKGGHFGEHPLFSDKDFTDSWLHKWSPFCKYWDIDIYWTGKLESLEEFLWHRIRIIYFPRPKKAEKGYLAIDLDAETTLKDIRAIWSKIDEYQKEWLGRKVKKKTNFGRDLCWYDLYKFGLSYKEIAELWAEKFPENIDLIVIRRLKRDEISMKEIREDINKDDELKALRSRQLKDREFLFEIRNGILAKKFKYIFDNEKDYYLKGKASHGGGWPPFIDVIRRAIERMEKYISQVEVKEKIEDIPDINLRYGIHLFP